jgi:tripartite ATP-independent transporter DctM subunit
MDPFLVGLIGVIALFLLLALGVHIGIALAASGFIGIALVTSFEKAIKLCVTALYHKISAPVLIILPLFILMGYLASGGGISSNLYNSLSLWFGRLRSGLGIATVFGCTAFGTVCGSSLVTTAVFTKICAPEMRRHGYDKQLAYAICASSGSIGMLIPPSILAIVYGMLSGVSIGKVLMAGVAPGIIWAAFFALTIVIIGRMKPSSIAVSISASIVTWREKLASILVWWPILLVAAITFGGIYGGVFSPSEAAAVAAFLLIVIYAFIRILPLRNAKRHESWRELRSMLVDTATTSALVFLVMGAATIFADFIVLTGMATSFSEFIAELGLSKLYLVLLFSFVYLALGCFLDSISMLCITIPLFNPIINAAGIDPIWYATIVIVSIEIGLITPPVGLNLYAAKGAAEPDVSLEDIIKGILPFLIAELISLAILLAFPILSTFLPSFVG